LSLLLFWLLPSIICLRCLIGHIEYEDHRYVAFRTSGSLKDHHYLVTPRKHIKNLKYVRGREGAKLLYNLKQVGMKVLSERSNHDKNLVTRASYSFHIPPHNSIDHLHLHVIGKPEAMSLGNWFKYPSIDTNYCQNVDTIIEHLDPCFFETTAKEKSEGELFENISEEYDMYNRIEAA
jgi:diadenosine tetraphosphate (Ap4A) HIT family hydrolase